MARILSSLEPKEEGEDENVQSEETKDVKPT
jgi:hypothetical protein